MERRVFIIQGAFTNDELVSANTYGGYYYEFFKGIAGGAYESDEIHYLKQPTEEVLKLKLTEASLDYAIIVFIGHGADDGSQLLKLNEKEIIRPGQYSSGAKKELYVLESCRSKLDETMKVDFTEKIPLFERGGVIREPLTRELARDIYNEHLLNCRDGKVVCFACEDGKEAWNYFFSQKFLEIPFSWHQDSQTHQKVLGIIDLMGVVKSKVPILSNLRSRITQNPQFSGCENFPIAVSKY